MATINKKTAAAIASLIEGATWAAERKSDSLKRDGGLYAFWDASLSEALCVIELADRFGIELMILDYMRGKVDFYRAKEEEHRPEELNWARA